MHLHNRIDPRRVALLLLPALLLAGSLQAEDPLRPSSPQAARVAPTWAAPVPDVLPAAVPAPLYGAVHAPRTSDRADRADRTDRADRADRASSVRRVRVAASGPASPEQRGQAALRSLGYDWRALGYRVQFRPYTGGTLGTANRVTRLITVYVKPLQSDVSLRVSLAHELGHALDFEHGNQERRDAYRRVRGLARSTAWFPCDRCNDYSSPAGDFAEVFALWLAGPGDFRSRLKGPPSRRELAELAPLFRIPRTTGSPRPSPAPQPTQEPDDDEPQGPLPVVVPPTPRAG